MKLTLPQIILLNHACYVNRENAERKFDAEQAAKEDGNYETAAMKVDRERVGDMKSEDLVGYVMSGW